MLEEMSSTEVMQLNPHKRKLNFGSLKPSLTTGLTTANLGFMRNEKLQGFIPDYEQERLSNEITVSLSVLLYKLNSKNSINVLF